MTESHEKSPWIVDAEEATFQQEVVERSRQVLVVIDFWAEWCQPCRLLGPILEKLAQDYDGKFLLVKAETEKLPNIAAGFGVQSIPAVYALRDGNLLDFFVGLRDEGQLRQWIDRLLPSRAEMLVAEARALTSSDAEAAEAKYREAAALDPNVFTAQFGLAELLLDQGRADESRAIIAELEERGFLEEEAEKIKARLHVMAGEHAPRDLESLRSKVAANEKDLSAKLELAEGLAAAGEQKEALETALEVVQAHDKETKDRARELMVDVFRLLPDDSPLVSEYRRRLSTALY
jgi:putative thioredoxin